MYQTASFMSSLFAFIPILLLLCCQSHALGSGYTISNISEAPDGNSITAQLQLIQNNSVNNSLYGPGIQSLQLLVRYESNDSLRVYITDASQPRWEVPSDILPRYGGVNSSDNSQNHTHELLFNYSNNPFGFAITRRSSGETLFNSTANATGNSLVFEDQYLEVSTALPSAASLYGLGESTRQTFLLNANQNYTLWNSDIGSSSTNVDLYGSHPFYLDVRAGGVAHGVLLLNSNGMDVEYGGSFLTYRANGGVLDLYFFSGPSPLAVIQQYTALIGRPAAMPYWSFGFHQCRYGYKNISDVESVVAGYATAQIPLEAIWTDIDHMDQYKDFTLDPVNFPEQEVQNFLERIHANGQKYVLIVDPGISVNESYKTYQNGKKDDIFIKQGGVPYLAQVWPGPVNFPDFLNPKTQSFWTNEISQFHDTVAFDGLWLDMNEISNFCNGITCSLPNDGSCPQPNSQTSCCLVCSDSNATKWDDPPYQINSAGGHRALGIRTIATSAVHYNGALEYNAHNLYGLSEAAVTNKALKSALQKRPFILTRSTFVGSGAHAAHWTGDNAATWNDISYSIPTILNFGLFGIPMVGADICGFLQDTNEELCNRWIQLGAFYPFARDHSDKSKSRQELYLWESVTKSAKKALGLRYQLLPYIYTLSFEAHTNGSPIARPLFFTFPEDSNTLGISTQFLLGKGVLVSPVLTQGAVTVDAYFPKGTWYNLFNVSDSVTVANGSNVTLQAPIDTINVHVYEGTILPLQQIGLTTSESRKSPFSLLVALGGGNQSYGDLYVDSGEDLEMVIANGKSSYIQFYADTAQGGVRVRSQVQQGAYAIGQGWLLKNITVLGSPSSVQSVTVTSNISFPIGRNFDVLIPWNK